MKAALALIQYIFYFDGNCILHQFHLIVKDGLEMIDAFLAELSSTCKHPCLSAGFAKYFASIAKITHYWRENASRFVDLWEATHGVHCGGIKYTLYPLKVVAGRWGSVDAAESFLLARGCKLLRPVLLKLLSKTMKVDKSAARARQGPALADDDDDEREAYHIRMTKWASGAFAAVTSTIFWLMLRVANTARKPLRHFHFWVQKNTRNRLLFQLVTGKGEEFMIEFKSLVDTFNAWFAAAVVEAGGEVPEEVLATVRSMAFKLVTHAAGQFHMRIIAPLGRLGWPSL